WIESHVRDREVADRPPLSTRMECKYDAMQAKEHIENYLKKSNRALPYITGGTDSFFRIVDQSHRQQLKKLAEWIRKNEQRAEQEEDGDQRRKGDGKAQVDSAIDAFREVVLKRRKEPSSLRRHKRAQR